MLGTMFAKAQSSSPACGREGPTATRWEDEGNRLIGALMVEQNIREALRIADKVYVLVGGTERFHGTVGELGDDRQLMALYMSAEGQQAGRDGPLAGKERTRLWCLFARSPVKQERSGH